MERVAILFGVLLCGLGLVGYFAPNTLGDPGDKATSPTALIPAGVGAILLICGLIVSAAPNTRKHVMHVAAAVGLIGAVGGIMPLMRSNFDFSKASAVSGLLMIVLCGLFVILCVRSFLQARAARAAGYPDRPA
jgi:FtsH-binding integral membrane protein